MFSGIKCEGQSCVNKCFCERWFFLSFLSRFKYFSMDVLNVTVNLTNNGNITANSTKTIVDDPQGLVIAYFSLFLMAIIPIYIGAQKLVSRLEDKRKEASEALLFSDKSYERRFYGDVEQSLFQFNINDVIRSIRLYSTKTNKKEDLIMIKKSLLIFSSSLSKR